MNNQLLIVIPSAARNLHFNAYGSELKRRAVKPDFALQGHRFSRAVQPLSARRFCLEGARLQARRAAEIRTALAAEVRS